PTVMLPVTLNVPVDGSYTSALAVSPAGAAPPATRTFPLLSSVAVSPLRATAMLPVALNVSVDGSYSSALVNPTSPMLFVPPRIRTFPLFSSVALAPARLIVIFPTELNVPLDGSYTSALAVSPPGVSPPATRTFPLFNRVAVAPWRAIVITPVETNCGKLPTNKVVIALADWYEAVIVVCPLVCVVTSPELSIVATVGAEDVQVTWCVRSC